MSTATSTRKVYATIAETNKVIKAILAQEFKGIKFSVSTKGSGPSTTISWTDGPTRKAVESIVDQFQSASFDGMQDMEIRTGATLPDGRKSGTKYIFCYRTYSKTLIQETINNLSRSLHATEAPTVEDYLSGSLLCKPYDRRSTLKNPGDSWQTVIYRAMET